MAVEVDDEAVNHLLAAKMKSGETVAAQVGPQNPFRRSHCSAKLPGAGEFFGGDWLADDNVGDGRGVGRNPSPSPSPKRGGEIIFRSLPASRRRSTKQPFLPLPASGRGLGGGVKAVTHLATPLTLCRTGFRYGRLCLRPGTATLRWTVRAQRPTESSRLASNRTARARSAVRRR